MPKLYILLFNKMVLLADEVNKIVWICPHKCGLNTITTYLMRLYGHDVTPCYYVENLKVMGYSSYKAHYKTDTYLKILLIRNPYERFVSGFLQDLEQYAFFRDIDLSFAEFCGFLHSIYKKENVNYYFRQAVNNPSSEIRPDKVILGEKCFLTGVRNSKIDSPNLLKTHLKPMSVDIAQELDFFKEKFDMVVTTRELDKLLLELQGRYPQMPSVEPVNQKNYGSEYQESVVSLRLKEIAAFGMEEGGRRYPRPRNFYNDEIKRIVADMYSQDFSLICRLKPGFDFESVFSVTEKVVAEGTGSEEGTVKKEEVEAEDHTRTEEDGHGNTEGYGQGNSQERCQEVCQEEDEEDEKVEDDVKERPVVVKRKSDIVREQILANRRRYVGTEHKIISRWSGRRYFVKFLL